MAQGRRRGDAMMNAVAHRVGERGRPTLSDADLASSLEATIDLVSVAAAFGNVAPSSAGPQALDDTVDHVARVLRPSPRLEQDRRQQLPDNRSFRLAPFAPAPDCLRRICRIKSAGDSRVIRFVHTA